MTKKQKRSLYRAAELLLSNGICLSWPGWYTIETPQDAVEVVEDPLAWEARQRGVSPERFVAWEKFMASGSQCNAITKDGERCKNGTQNFPEAHEFVPGITDRCRLHAPKSTSA